MRKRVRFPIRLKIFMTLLVVVTLVLGLITYNMANLFHGDKKAYIHDLTSVIALHAAEETRTIILGFRKSMQIIVNLVFNENLSSGEKEKMLKRLFQESREFLSITVYGQEEENITLYDFKTLRDAGLTKNDFAVYRKAHPLPFDQIKKGMIFVENSTLSEKLPTMTIATTIGEGDDKRETVVSALLRLDNLQRIASKSKVFETFLVDFRGIPLAAKDQEMVIHRVPVTYIPKSSNVRNLQTLSTSLEYRKDGVEMIGGFANVGIGDLLVGVQIPRTAVYLTARELLSRLILVSILLLFAAVLLSNILSRRVTQPIEKLSRATEDVGRGRFDVHVGIKSSDEIGVLADSFNSMATELKDRDESLKEAQAKLIQSEKMAAFGQLGAGIAHEVKNPLSGILGYAELSLMKMKEDEPSYEYVKIIEKETMRCNKIIENLLKFSRQEKVAFEPLKVNFVLDDSVAIVDHQLGMHQITLERDCAPDLPKTMGNPNQIQQVLMNIMINAQQAMDGKPGSIKVSTREIEGERIEIRVTDTGPGMPEEVQARLFEPFFTTKEAGKGTGLGLSVSYGIIKDHGGDITVESEAGKGSTFVITLPVIDSEGAPPAH